MQLTFTKYIGTFVNIRLNISIYILLNVTKNMNCVVFKVMIANIMRSFGARMEQKGEFQMELIPIKIT